MTMKFRSLCISTLMIIANSLISYAWVNGYDRTGWVDELEYEYVFVSDGSTEAEKNEARTAKVIGYDLKKLPNYVEGQDGHINIGGYAYIWNQSYKIISIKSKALQNCPFEVNIGSNVTELGPYALAGTPTKELVGRSLEDIGPYALADCKQLVRINLTKSAYIYYNAFSGCEEINSIYFGDIVHINQEAFSSLKGGTIVSKGIPINIHPNAFSTEAYENCILYVPEQYIAEYKSSTGWENFKNVYALENRITRLQLPQTTTIGVGNTVGLTVTTTPQNADTSMLTWLSDTPEVATVENGVVTAHKIGTATIKASTIENISASCEVKVIASYPTSISLNATDIGLKVFESYQLKAELTPEEVENNSIVWSSSNDDVATVSEDGTVTAVSVGVATITATCGEASSTCKVTVNPIVASSVTLNVPDLTLLIGQTEKLTATIEPENTTDQTIIWTSDNEDIAKVSEDGTVTAVSVGVATITGTCGEVSATCKVTVNPVLASSVTLNVPDLTLLIGQTEKLSTSIEPENTTDQTITWTSDNEDIAKVSEDGTVTAISVGVATITATCGEVSATCKVTVNPVLASSVTLNVPDLTLLIGQTEKLSASIEPENTTDQTITWTSNNEAIAKVSEDGTVTAISVGVVTITATCGEVSATCKVTVNPIAASSVTLNVPDLTLLIGQTEKLTATIEPENTTDQTITWTSDNEAIAKVSEDGTVTAISVGAATITATCGEVSATCKVTVNPVVASSVTLNVEDITLFVGQSDKLMATIDPENTTDKTIAWTCDNEAIAKVSEDGTVTAIAVGVTNITATCGEVSATCKVTVNPVVASSVTLNVEDITLFVGQSDKLMATIDPENTTDKTIAWTCDNEAIAKVSEDGTVTAIAVGVANITATCGDVSATCKVTVNPVVASSVTLNVEDMTLLIGQTDKLTATIEPENTTTLDIIWTSDDEAIAKVSTDGIVTAVSVGVATITATCGNVSATCKVTVNPVPVSSIGIRYPIDNEEGCIYPDETLQLTAIIYPDNATDKSVHWESTDENIAIVDENGLVTGLYPGDVKIVATASNGIYDTCLIIVNEIKATDVTLDVEDITLLVGESAKLLAKIGPSNATNKSITWISDNDAIATVFWDGTVTAIAAGVANITATCGEVSATCKVTVMPDVVRPETPSAFKRKGDGRSCTFVVMMNLSNEELTEQGYKFVYGYTDNTGMDYVIANTPLRYCHTSEQIYNDPSNDFWVFAYQEQENDKFVNSDRRHLDGSVDANYDGTKLINKSRSSLNSGTDPDNWIKATAKGVRINIESEEDTELNIYTLTGLPVQSQVFEGGVSVNEEIDHNTLAAGIYIMSIKSGSKSISKKIMIQ